MPLKTLSLLFLVALFVGACDLSYPTANWADQNYDHASLSGGFDLTGPHAGNACEGCHATGNFGLLYQPTSNQDCQACHSADFQAQHGADAYPTTCLTCHSGVAWERSEFDHNQDTGFTLNNIHIDKPCTRCHQPNTWIPRYNPTSQTDCVACHG